VAYPFGYGLIYTDFEFSDLQLSKSSFAATDESMDISVKVTNTGAALGKAEQDALTARTETEQLRMEAQAAQQLLAQLQNQASVAPAKTTITPDKKSYSVKKGKKVALGVTVEPVRSKQISVD